MATISLSDAVPADAGKVHFSFGSASFDLDGSGTYETKDASVLASAAEHPWLKVNDDDVASAEKTAEDVAAEVAASKDPHVNRAADHLSGVASDEVIKAAADANHAIQVANGTAFEQEEDSTEAPKDIAATPIPNQPVAPSAPVQPSTPATEGETA